MRLAVTQGTHVVNRIMPALAIVLLASCASKGPPPSEEKPPVTQPSAAARQADASSRFAEGVSYARNGATDKAIAVFRGLTEDYPDLPGPYNNLAVLYASRGRYEDARQVLERAIELQPDLDTAHENLGDIHVKLAVSAYQRATEVGEGNRRARSKIEALKLLLHPGVRRDEPVPLTAASDQKETATPVARSRRAAAPPAPSPSPRAQAPACYTLGPISSLEQIDRMRGWLGEKRLPFSTRKAEAELASFYRVHLPPLGSLDEARQEVDRIKAMGVRDLSVIRHGALQNGIALGAYRQQSSVKRRLAQLRDLGLRPEVEVIKRQQVTYWVDLGPAKDQQSWARELAKAFPDHPLKAKACERRE